MAPGRVSRMAFILAVSLFLAGSLISFVGVRFGLGGAGHVGVGFFVPAVGLFLAGSLISLVEIRFGLAVGGIGLIAFGLWLMRNDIARRTVRKSGLTRFIAVCLLPGYVWLIAGGVLWLAFGGTSTARFLYDAMLHSLFLGFVFSMIFGHAPIIVPAVMNMY